MRRLRNFLAFCVVCSVAELQPPCRKSPIVRTLAMPGVETGTQSTVLVFGGKGYRWERAKHKRKPKKQVRYFNDMWIFDLLRNNWQQVKLLQPLAPPGRWKAEAGIWLGKRMVLFGGCLTGTAIGVLNDLWVFTSGHGEDGASGQWHPIATVNPPQKRRGHVVVANETHLLIFGGKTYGTKKIAGTFDKCITDLWTLPLAALELGADPAAWTQGSSFPGPCRWGATGTIVAKPGGQFLAIFGGRSLSPTAMWHSTDPEAYIYYGETWLYDFAADTWELVKLEGEAPQPRDHHAATLVNGEVYVFAGRLSEENRKTANTAEVWSFNVAARRWTLRHGDGSGSGPSRRYMPGISAVQYNGEEGFIAFGGEHLPGSTKKSTSNDVWLYLPSRGWEMMRTSQCRKNTGIFVVPVMSDASSQRLVGESMLTGYAMIWALAVMTLFASLASFAFWKLNRRVSPSESEEAFVVLEGHARR